MRITYGKCKHLTAVSGMLLIILCGKLFFFDVTRVYGHSMEPILSHGQIIISFRVSYGFLLPFINRYLLMWKKPSKGDIIVLENPREKKTIVKRCIGVEGDVIDIKGGQLFVGNKPVPGMVPGTATVPRDHVFVIGDNVDQSIDSRSFGFVPIDKVYGKVILIPGSSRG